MEKWFTLRLSISEYYSNSRQTPSSIRMLNQDNFLEMSFS